MRMLNDNVLIEPLKRPELSSGGIILPDSAAERTALARIISIGPGCRIRGTDQRTKPHGLLPLQLIFFDRYACGGDTFLSIDGTEHKLIKIKHIIFSIEF